MDTTIIFMNTKYYECLGSDRLNHGFSKRLGISLVNRLACIKRKRHQAYIFNALQRSCQLSSITSSTDPHYASFKPACKQHRKTPARLWKYPYRPLQANPPEIRLITLLPGPFSSPICATLSTVSLRDNPAYDAIPYVWGDPSLTVPILLDEIEYPVTVNLELALRYCRLESNSRVLWADAICIYVY